MDVQNYTTALVVEAAARAASKQSTYRKYANTINATLAALAGVLTALAGQWAITGQFPEAQAILVVVAPLLTLFVTYLTKNGISPSVERELLSEAHNMEARAGQAAPQPQPDYPAKVADIIGAVQGAHAKVPTLDELRAMMQQNR